MKRLDPIVSIVLLLNPIVSIVPSCKAQGLEGVRERELERLLKHQKKLEEPLRKPRRPTTELGGAQKQL